LRPCPISKTSASRRSSICAGTASAIIRPPARSALLPRFKDLTDRQILDGAFYAQVKRDEAPINLCLVCEPVYVGDIRERGELLGASMTVDSAAEIKQLFLQYQAAGVDFFRPLRQEPWGARNFIVRDSDGNLLLFAGPAS
jgi:hypothetical protein